MEKKGEKSEKFVKWESWYKKIHFASEVNNLKAYKHKFSLFEVAIFHWLKW